MAPRQPHDTGPDSPRQPMNPGLGYSRQCRPCNSPFRAEIDRRLLAGESARSVSAWLATEGERIPHHGLSNHRSEHLDAHAEAVVRIEAAAQVAAAQPVFDAAVQKVVADAAVLNEVAEISLSVARKLGKSLADGGSLTQPMATAFSAALTNARGAATDRHELLYGKKLNVESNQPAAAAPEADALHARLAQLAAVQPSGDDPGAAGGAQPG